MLLTTHDNGTLCCGEPHFRKVIRGDNSVFDLVVCYDKLYLLMQSLC